MRATQTTAESSSSLRNPTLISVSRLFFFFGSHDEALFPQEKFHPRSYVAFGSCVVSLFSRKVALHLFQGPLDNSENLMKAILSVSFVLTNHFRSGLMCM